MQLPFNNYMSVRTFFEEPPPTHTPSYSFMGTPFPFLSVRTFQWPQSIFKIHVACSKFTLRYHVSLELNRPFSTYLPTSADVVCKSVGSLRWPTSAKHKSRYKKLNFNTQNLIHGHMMIIYYLILHLSIISINVHPRMFSLKSEVKYIRKNFVCKYTRSKLARKAQ